MNTSRRSLLGGLIAAPAVILTPRLLMPVRAQPILTNQFLYQVNFYKNGLWVGGTNPTKGHYARVDFEQTESFTADDTISIEWAGLGWRG